MGETDKQQKIWEFKITTTELTLWHLLSFHSSNLAISLQGNSITWHVLKLKSTWVGSRSSEKLSYTSAFPMENLLRWHSKIFLMQCHRLHWLWLSSVGICYEPHQVSEKRILGSKALFCHRIFNSQGIAMRWDGSTELLQRSSHQRNSPAEVKRGALWLGFDRWSGVQNSCSQISGKDCLAYSAGLCEV